MHRPFAPNYNPEANVEDGSCDPIPCPEGNQATLTITNLTLVLLTSVSMGKSSLSILATPTGPYGAVAEVELEEGTNIIQADLPLITVCLERDTTIEAVCGEGYSWDFY